MSNFLKSRISTREFKNKELNEEYISKIRQLLEEKNKNSKSSFILSLNSKNIYDSLNGIGGYSGFMIKAPAYIALHTPENDEKAVVEGAFKLESIISELEEIGLGSCWVTLKDVEDEIKKQLFGYADGNIFYILAIGLPQRVEFKQRKISERIGIDQFVFINDLNTPASVEELEARGLDDLFFYLRYAPSAYNKQPWRFVIKENEVELYVENFNGVENLIDSGIIMYYFKKLSETIGINAIWEISPNNLGNYEYIAKTRI
ncbi:MAG: nitroreductase family protein [Peptoniphilaceae bacterium]|nr:nitroreductase [Peptoniphilaceae bacterium]MDD7383413.1 nitroreductase family protein [Peptoniphilaceae bacterium]MDY3738808.1 nitroreductase family protein [Peptoniphilaceae bacterium]